MKTITIHEAEPEQPPDCPLLWTASGEPVVEKERRKVIGFHGKGER